MFRPLLRVAAAVAACALPLAAQAPAGYHLVKKIPVGGEGGWDYLAVEGSRLYVSHATKLVVIDLATDSIVGEVPNTNGIHGAALVPALGRGFTSNGRDTSVTIFDLKTLAVLGTVKGMGANPDAIHYDAASGRVFTFNGRGLDATAIDPANGTVVGSVPLGAKPEFAQTDGKGRLFVNLETDTGQVVVLDTKALKEAKRYPLPGCEEPTGLAYDAARDRLFSVCGNKVMTVSNPTTGQVVATVPIGPGVDAAAYDPQTRLVFASNGGDGTLTVVRQESADRYVVVEQAATQRGSRTMALDPRTHRIYLAAAEFTPPPAPAPGQRPGRPQMVPGSFSILVMAPAK